MAASAVSNCSHPSCQERLDQAQIIFYIIGQLNDRLEWCAARQKNLALANSITRGLYDEISRLSWRIPLDPLSPLEQEQVNRLLCDVKKLVWYDRCIQELEPFTPHDCPDYRQAVVILRMLRQGLERFGEQMQSFQCVHESRLSQAKTVQAALSLVLPTGFDQVTRREIEAQGVTPHEAWCVDFAYSNSTFDFAKLDSTDLKDYFLNNWEKDPIALRPFRRGS